jgi:hypothetical protein
MRVVLQLGQDRILILLSLVSLEVKNTQTAAAAVIKLDPRKVAVVLI